MSITSLLIENVQDFQRKYDFIETVKNKFDEGSIYYSWFKWIQIALKLERMFTDEIHTAGKPIAKHIDIKPITDKESAMEYFIDTYDRYHPLRNNVETLDSVEVVRIYYKNNDPQKLVESALFDPRRVTGDEEFSGTRRFNTPPTKEELKNWDKYHGRNIVWYGRKGETMQMHKDDVYPVEGQVWDSDELREVVQYIKDADDKVNFVTGWGIPTIVDIQDIIEEQQAYYNDHFESDYSYEEPSTLEDEDMDTYLGNPREFVENNFYWEDDELLDFVEENEYEVLKGHKTEEQVTQEYRDSGIPTENDEAFDEWLQMELSIRQAIQDEDGDLGRVRMQMRDGNHRTFGAIASGEEYVFVRVDMNHFPEELKHELI